MIDRLHSALGAVTLLGFAFAACPSGLRRQIRWSTIASGLALLFALAFLSLRPPLNVLFAWATRAVDAFLSFSEQGAAFVFGPLVRDQTHFGFIFAFQVLPTVIFFAACMSVLYYVGIMPLVIGSAGRLLSRWLGTSGAESFSTVADIFVGQTEAPLVIKPYLATMTRSELMACMTAGFATTAGGVLAAYVVMLRAWVPDIAGHLIACSVMCAPASLVIAKLMLPEIDQPQTQGGAVLAREARRPGGLLESITTGTGDGLRLAVNVGAMLISFLALTALVDFGLNALGQFAFHTPLSLERVFSWLFAPLAWLLGVRSEDVFKVAGLLGQKTVLNEFVAYTTLTEKLRADPSWLSERSRVIASYALCGFANFGSIGIQIGGYASLAPERRSDFAQLAPRAMLAGLLTTCLVSCVAGILL
ncbi:MAG TPA: nucleoside transporter C-terminal domain-containing protein [Polyangiales bacterium]|nr:nucleoside transporter C-terminal domain-containing protein [Polyangiales bacterium]